MWLLDRLIGRNRQEQMRQQTDALRDAGREAQDRLADVRRNALDLAELGGRHCEELDDVSRRMKEITSSNVSDRVQGVWGSMVDRMREQ